MLLVDPFDDTPSHILFVETKLAQKEKEIRKRNGIENLGKQPRLRPACVRYLAGIREIYRLVYRYSRKPFCELSNFGLVIVLVPLKVYAPMCPWNKKSKVK